MQVCTKCKIEKDFLQFHRNTLTASGLVSRCKQCIAEADAKRYVPCSCSLSTFVHESEVDRITAAFEVAVDTSSDGNDPRHHLCILSVRNLTICLMSATCIARAWYTYIAGAC